MAVGIVDQFKVIEVDHYERAEAAITASARYLALSLFDEAATGERAGKLIHLRYHTERGGSANLDRLLSGVSA
ncbi:putative NAD/FAD-binding protein [Sphingomonas sp. UYP23]